MFPEQRAKELAATEAAMAKLGKQWVKVR